MNYEEKYKQALERAKYALDTDMDDSGHWAVNYIFPELKESEDERIRKKVIEVLKLNIKGAESQMQASRGVDRCFEIYACNKVIAWLEKQGKHTQFDYEHADIPQKDFAPIESKFKVGDWISGYYANYKVTAINSKGYVVEDIDGNKINILFENEKFHHLWAIQDAKDGDVLVASDGSIFLFAGVDDCACKYYVALTTDNHVEINKDSKGGYWETSRAVYPAAKEQRDLLFQKMADAGYEWDGEKKGLKKIESKTLDTAKVIEWIECEEFQGWAEPIDIRPIIRKFKKDFGL